jgi:hypothetical protein
MRVAPFRSIQVFNKVKVDLTIRMFILMLCSTTSGLLGTQPKTWDLLGTEVVMVVCWLCVVGSWC